MARSGSRPRPRKRLRRVGPLDPPLDGIAQKGWVDDPPDKNGPTEPAPTGGFARRTRRKGDPMANGARRLLNRLFLAVVIGFPSVTAVSADDVVQVNVPSQTRLDVRISPIVDFHFFIRVHAQAGAREVAEPK